MQTDLTFAEKNDTYITKLVSEHTASGRRHIRWTLEKTKTRTAMKAAKACSALYSVAVAALMMIMIIMMMLMMIMMIMIMMMMTMMMMMMTMMNKILTKKKGLFSFTKKSKARPTKWQWLRWHANSEVSSVYAI